MSKYLVLTVIGDDRPGLVEEVAAVISAHQGNWLDSTMSRLAGKFAGVVTVSVPEHTEAELLAALRALTSVRITAEGSEAPEPEPEPERKQTRRLSFTLVGHDRVGIVREVSQVFAHHEVNVEKLVTWVSTAPMSSESLFHAEADLLVHGDLDPDVLKSALEKLSNELIADISLDERRP